MFKKIILSIAGWAFKLLLKFGVLQLARLLLIILFPLYLASFAKKSLLPICVFISLLCVCLCFFLIYL